MQSNLFMLRVQWITLEDEHCGLCWILALSNRISQRHVNVRTWTGVVWANFYCFPKKVLLIFDGSQKVVFFRCLHTIFASGLLLVKSLYDAVHPAYFENRFFSFHSLTKLKHHVLLIRFFFAFKQLAPNDTPSFRWELWLAWQRSVRHSRHDPYNTECRWQLWILGSSLCPKQRKLVHALGQAQYPEFWKKMRCLSNVYSTDVGGPHFWFFSCLLRTAECILYAYLIHHVHPLCIYTTIYIFWLPPAMTKGRPQTTMV